MPRDARWPVRFGGFGHQTTIGRNTGLLLWPLLGGAVASVAWMGDGELTGLAVAGLGLMVLAQLAAVMRLAD